MPAAGSAVPAPLDALLQSLVTELRDPPPGRGPGRPAILPAAALWGALVAGVLTGDLSQVAIWRRIRDPHWWYQGQLQISKEAVYHRLDSTGPSPMQAFFTTVTAHLLARQETVPGCAVAPGFREVVALDGSTLDAVARRLPSLRAMAPDNFAVLPGKLTAVFDLRRQLFRRIDWHSSPTQNDKVGARDAVADLPAGSLIVADLGYFGFRWFDELTDAGQFWVSKYRAKTSLVEIEVLYEDGPTRDVIVWLGAHRADQAQHPVRLIQFEHNGQLRRYLTNVRDPQRLSMRAVAALYARRWDIELAFKLAKTDLKLHLLWSAKPAVIAHQVWAVLLIAQLVLMLRTTVAVRAAVADVFMVSVNLLVRYLPPLALTTGDPIGAFIANGWEMGFLRKSRRIEVAVPDPPPEAVRSPTVSTGLTRKPRYADKA